ncbi:DUF3606 domain-containing protein [Variovorax boronicumulans]|uniref:DUF3606 domain-containing protein n=1 Tax=Variovorax boronicumulans TaxID=436515 RepID=UPI003393C155
MANTSDASTPRIDQNNAADVARYTREFDVTDEQLSQAIAKVGDKAADVELYLKGSRSSTNADTAGEAAP